MSSSSDNNIDLRVGISGVSAAKAGLQDIAKSAQDAQLQVARAADSATASLQKQLTQWTNNVDPAARAQAQLAKGQTVFNEAMAAGLITGDQHAALLAKLEGKYGAGSAAVAAYGVAHAEASGHIEGFREVLHGATDVATGNITGLARAGAMLANTFGLLTNPVTLGAAAIAAGFAAAFIRAEQLDAEARTLDAALRGMGNTAGTSAQQLTALAHSIEEAGASRAQAQSLVLQGARSGNLTPSGIGALSDIALGIGAATGTDPSAAMAKLIAVAQQGYPAIEQLDREFNFLTRDELKQIQAMTEHGDRAGALGLAVDALGKRFNGLHEQSLTPLQKDLHDLGVAWDGLLDKLGKNVATPVLDALNAFVKSFSGKGQKLFEERSGQLDQNGVTVPIPATNDADYTNFGKFGDNTGSGLLASGGPADAARNLALVALGKEIAGEQRMAAAFEQGTAAGLRATAMEQGRLQSLRDSTLSEGEYARAILARSEAEAQAASARAVEQAQRANASAGGVLSASRLGAGAEARARAANQALQTVQPEFDAANAASDAAAYDRAQKHLEQLTQELQLREQINRDIQTNDENRQLQQTLQEKQLELSLMRQTPELRAQEIADLQTRNQLLNEGYEIGTQAFDDELVKRRAINREIAAAVTASEREQKNQRDIKQQAQELAGFGESAFRELSNGTETWHQKLTNIGQAFADLILKMTVMKTLEDAINQAWGGKTGTGGLGGALLSLFGGGGSDAATSAAFDSSSGALATEFAGAGFANGGVFDRGLKIKRFANGGVVNQPTLFAMASGLGMMGEAGPEAAMPLKQLSNGKLGVHAEGMGGTANHFYIDARGADPAAANRIEVLSRQLAALNGSVETRAIAAIHAARNAMPSILGPRYGS